MSTRLRVLTAAAVGVLLCAPVAVAQAAAVDPNAPTLAVPTAVTVYADDTSHAVRVWYGAAAVDAVDGPLTVSCDVASGSTFPLGSHTVTCSATNSRAVRAAASFVVRVTLHAGRFAAPLAKDGLVQKGNQLAVRFTLYRADGVTALSDRAAAGLLSAGRVKLTIATAGRRTTVVPLTYDAAKHRFAATVQTFSWVGGANYTVAYAVSATDGSVVASRHVTLGVRLGA